MNKNILTISVMSVQYNRDYKYRKGGEFLKISNKKLVVAMANRCVSQDEVAKAAGVNPMTISRARNGQGNIQPSTIGKIAKALNVQVEELLEDEPGVAAPVN